MIDPRGTVLGEWRYGGPSDQFWRELALFFGEVGWPAAHPSTGEALVAFVVRHEAPPMRVVHSLPPTMPEAYAEVYDEDGELVDTVPKPPEVYAEELVAYELAVDHHRRTGGMAVVKEGPPPPPRYAFRTESGATCVGEWRGGWYWLEVHEGRAR